MVSAEITGRETAHDEALEEAAAICDRLGDAEFAARMKKGNGGIATMVQRHYMKCAAAIREAKHGGANALMSIQKGENVSRETLGIG